MLTHLLSTGQHRSLGSNISKVQSLKLDTSVWSNEIVQVEALRAGRWGWHGTLRGQAASPGRAAAPQSPPGCRDASIQLVLVLAMTRGLSCSSSSCWGMTEPTGFGLLASPLLRRSTRMPVLSKDETSSPANTERVGTACPTPTMPLRRTCSR